MGDATLYTVLPTHTAAAGVALAGVGILLGANRAVRLLLNGPTGLAYDRLPRRWLFIPALFIGALSTAIYAATRGFWPLLLGRLLWGLAWSGISIGGATMVLDVAVAHERGRWTGLYQIWSLTGGALGALGGGVLTDWLGYGMTMWVASALTGAGGVAALLLLPETGGRHRRINNTDCSGCVSGPQSTTPLSTHRPQLRISSSFGLTISLQGISRFIFSGVISATIALVVQDWAQSVNVALGVATLTGMLMAGRTALSVAAAPLAGIVSDRLGNRWTVAAWGIATGAAGMALLAGSTLAFVVVGLAVLAVSQGGIRSLITALAGDLIHRQHRGRAIGLLQTAGDFGSAIGPSIAYLLLPWIGLRTIYLLCAVVFLVLLIPVLGSASADEIA